MPQKKHLIQGATVNLKQLIQMRYYARGIKFRQDQKIHEQLIGGHLSKFRGRGMDFSEVRIYQAGDDIRNMDWRVTARTNTPHTKLYHEERERPVYFFVDLTSSAFFGSKVCFKSVLACEISSILAWAANQQGDRVGGLIFNEQQDKELRPLDRKRGVLQLLRSLEEFSDLRQMQQSQNPNAFNAALAKLCLVARHGGLIFIVSDFYQMNEQSQSYLARLSQHNQVTALHVYDKLEAVAPMANDYVISNGKEKINMNTSSKNFQQQYEQQFQQQIKNYQKQMHQNNIPFISIRTDSDIISRLREVFS